MASKTQGKKIVARKNYQKFISVTEKKRRHIASGHCKSFIMGIVDEKADLGGFQSLPRTQGKWYSFAISCFPAGKGSCLVLETTSLDHGDVLTGFGPVLVSAISL